MTMPSVLIVGGGMCGLMAATALQRQGVRVTILDKGRGIGGRLASRRLRYEHHVGCFDFGAQYFKASTPTFKRWVEEWRSAGVVTVWSEGMATVDGKGRSQGIKLYRGEPSNRSLAQYLAQDLSVVKAERVTHFAWSNHQWQVQGESGQAYRADWLILTPPLPQTLALLDASNIALPSYQRHALATIRYAPCLTLLALLPQPSPIPAPGGVFLSGEPLAWIACNHQKGISPGGYAVTIQAGPAFSQALLEAAAAVVEEQLLIAAQPWLGSTPLATHLHRWRYSQPQDFYDESFVFGEWPGPIYLGGDAFLWGKVEGAALSGLAIAEDLLSKIP